MRLVELAGVRRCYGDVEALDGADLTVESGQVVGLLGGNGAGKTTLIRILLGLERADAGSVLLFGEPPSRGGRRRVGYVPQGLGLWADLTVGENVAFSASAYGLTDEPARRVAETMGSETTTLVEDLPLGPRRRLAMAVACMHDPDLLLLDEPTSGVGPLQRARLWEGIADAAQHGAGVLVTTHHLAEAEQCDVLVVLDRGRVVAHGTLEDVIGERKVVQVQARDWRAALRALAAAELPASLDGTRLRIASGAEREVEKALVDAGVEAQVGTAPAGLEEAFLQLVSTR